MAKESKTRMIDKEEIHALIADLHMKQLQLLMEKIDEGYLEPQEQRLIWDMVKAHNIGIDSIDDMVDKANSDLEGRIDAMNAGMNDDWTFEQ